MITDPKTDAVEPPRPASPTRSSLGAARGAADRADEDGVLRRRSRCSARSRSSALARPLLRPSPPFRLEPAASRRRRSRSCSSATRPPSPWRGIRARPSRPSAPLARHGQAAADRDPAVEGRRDAARPRDRAADRSRSRRARPQATRCRARRALHAWRRADSSEAVPARRPIESLPARRMRVARGGRQGPRSRRRRRHGVRHGRAAASCAATARAPGDVELRDRGAGSRPCARPPVAVAGAPSAGARGGRGFAGVR